MDHESFTALPQLTAHLFKLFTVIEVRFEQKWVEVTVGPVLHAHFLYPGWSGGDFDPLNRVNHQQLELGVLQKTANMRSTGSSRPDQEH